MSDRGIYVIGHLVQDIEYSFRITDLRHPLLTAEHRQVLDYFDRNPVDLSETAVLDAARQGTGLYDFGGDDFRERLRTVLCESVRDRNRTTFGRYQVFNMCVRFASARLRLTELIKRHPEIHEVQIREPIIMVGPPRSASTYLHNLLAADSRLRSLSSREAFDPAASNPAAIVGVHPEVVSQINKVEHDHSIRFHGLPPSADDNLALEAVLLQGLDFAPGLVEALNVVHFWQDYDINYDQTPHYRYMETALKSLQWQRGPNRWVIKSPHYAEQLKPLLRTFPDAFFIFTYRDPIAIVKSMTRLISVAAQLHLRQVDVESIASYWIERIDILLRGLIQGREMVPAERGVDVHFDDFMDDNIRAVKQVYDKAEICLTDNEIGRMRKFIQDFESRAASRVSCDLQRDLGLNLNKVRKRFDFYYEKLATL